mmetsp:Transcript_28719/g.82531  ORF Transcript_28719/g.82531 Transcript_28719/m.82531 type:complete len:311 (-) Transcript_28719:33-965(-)
MPPGKVAKKPAASKAKGLKAAAKSKVAARAKAVGGGDTKGSKYESVDALWEQELKGEKGRDGWYAKGESYWNGQDASIDGVLGGFAETHGPDIRESKRFLELLRRSGDLAVGAGDGSALDCGAGIGRVTAGLLRDQFGQVDLVEPNQRLLSKAVSDMEGDVRVRNFTCCPLQKMQIADEDYDVIWAQWVLLYLPDDDLVAFFERCKRMLRSGGLICVKENVVNNGGKFMVDREDNSISRTDEQYKAVFERAGLRLVHQMQQTCWPSHLVPVRMYALRPMDNSSVVSSSPPAAAATAGAVARKRPAAAALG